jgi:YidC/Oxa1 family membrane protein insertase
VEKRFALFLVLSSLILFGSLMLQNAIAPRRPAPGGAARDGAEKPPDDQPAKPGAAGEKAGEPSAPAPAKEPVAPAKTVSAEPPPPPQRGTLGSLAPDSPFRLLVTWNNRGGAIERIELTQRTAAGRFRYSDLEAPGGYLGHLGAEDAPGRQGCRITVVGAGTPAATAKAGREGVADGLQAGDVITAIDGTAVPDAEALAQCLSQTKRGQTLDITVQRGGPAGGTTEQFSAQLTEHPLSVIQPERDLDTPDAPYDPLSYLLTLESIGDQQMPRDASELPGLPSMRDGYWRVQPLADDGLGPGVEFRFRLPAAALQEIGVTGEWEIVKRYRLATTPAENVGDPDFRSWHLTFDLEFHNRGAADQMLAYRLDGPNGLPLEGWWYSNKIHNTKFSAVGARDVVWSTPEAGHDMMGCPRIYEDTRTAGQKKLTPAVALFADPQPHAVKYAGVDSQYFVAALQPPDPQAGSSPLFKLGQAIRAGELTEKKGMRNKTANVTFRLVSQPQSVPAGQSLKQQFVLFAGPKRPGLLENYGLEQCLTYGWFPIVAKPLAAILHFFERLPLVNWGLAIILLTALVRGLMIPLSRKAARNAQVMQELAPEMKKIAEKYKDDAKKRMEAQQELWKKHNHNPFGGCLLVFIQLPIFVGLYRALSVDIELRQAPLFEGLAWCSNLAGPDMLWNWKDYVWAYLADEAGWLGPYLNVLPIITIVLFIVQQKMFMPPATDEQTRMQQKMMNIMMIVMGVFFYKVPSGLCVYFIASSIWGIVERKILPPVGKKKPDSAAAQAVAHKEEKRRARMKRRTR